PPRARGCARRLARSWPPACGSRHSARTVAMWRRTSARVPACVSWTQRAAVDGSPERLHRLDGLTVAREERFDRQFGDGDVHCGAEGRPRADESELVIPVLQAKRDGDGRERRIDGGAGIAGWIGGELFVERSQCSIPGCDCLAKEPLEQVRSPL